VLTTFSLSVWLTIGLVLLLTTAVFWCAGNGPYRAVYNETQTHQSLSVSTLLGLFLWECLSHSSPHLLASEFFFFPYVSFCFTISTLFQAFFVSYLVEPTYEKKLETLDELQNSDVVYGYHSIVNFAQGTAEYPELVTFLEHKTLQEDCSDMRKCVERMITKRDIATFSSPLLATYVARENGTVDVGKIICSLDETLKSGGAVVLFKK